MLNAKISGRMKIEFLVHLASDLNNLASYPDSYAMAIIAGLPFFTEFSDEGTERLQFEQGLSRALSVEGQSEKFQSFLHFVISCVPLNATVRNMLHEIHQRESNQHHVPSTRRPVCRLYMNFLSSWLYFCFNLLACTSEVKG